MSSSRKHEASLVVSSQEAILGDFRAYNDTGQKKHKEFHFRNVMMHPYGARIDSPFNLEDTLTLVGEEGVVFLALQNQI